MTSFRGSAQPRDRAQISHIAGRFFNVWASWKPFPYQKKQLRDGENKAMRSCLAVLAQPHEPVRRVRESQATSPAPSPPWKVGRGPTCRLCGPSHKGQTGRWSREARSRLKRLVSGGRMESSRSTRLLRRSNNIAHRSLRHVDSGIAGVPVLRWDTHHHSNPFLGTSLGVTVFPFIWVPSPPPSDDRDR